MSCQHIINAQEHEPQSTEGCQACLEIGNTNWVHLRMCLECGNVGCCDSSPYQHATKHFKETEHPVMRSVQPGESWRWCYVDETVG
jgi:uncharacterized UBP type Zn finger protein